MLFRKREYAAERLGSKAWMRFRRNKPAMFGLIVIALACFVAVAGYHVTPDETPFANEQHPELHILRPGSSVKMLLVRKNETYDPPGPVRTMISGRPSEFTPWAINGYRFNGADMTVELYSESGRGETLAFNLADIVHPLDASEKPAFDTASKTISFRKAGEKQESSASLEELRAQAERQVVTKTYLLGTDLLGRDLLSRLLIGTRISLGVGLVSVLISVIIGVLLGSMAGYFRGRTDGVIMWLVNVVWSVPTLLLVIAITLVLGKGVTQVFIAVGLTMWVGLARVVRGQVMGLREKEFVEAGKALGFSSARIIFRHILPNITGAVVVLAADNFAAAILTEAGLSFLGIGAQPPIPSWGEMTNAHRGYILMDRAYLAFIPGIAIMLLVLSFMLVGNGLRDAIDERATDEPTVPNV